MPRLRPHHVAIASAALTAASLASHVRPVTIPSHCRAGVSLPDPKCTPGVTNPSVTQANIQTTICSPGYTRTIRPPLSYTNPLKIKLMASYGDTGAARDYELDHYIALELGGNPTSPQNLWPQPYAPVPGAHEKDNVENFLNKQVCSGAMKLAEAQHLISTDWTKVQIK